MNNKKVKIKYILNNKLDNSYHHLLIFNNKNELLYDGYTDIRGHFTFYAPYFGIYKIIILVPEKRAYEIIKILVQENKNNYFSFQFKPNNEINLHTVTFFITDKNYQGLPLQKGEIFLWPNNT